MVVRQGSVLVEASGIPRVVSVRVQLESWSAYGERVEGGGGESRRVVYSALHDGRGLGRSGWENSEHGVRETVGASGSGALATGCLSAELLRDGGGQDARIMRRTRTWPDTAVWDYFLQAPARNASRGVG